MNQSPSSGDCEVAAARTLPENGRVTTEQRWQHPFEIEDTNRHRSTDSFRVRMEAGRLGGGKRTTGTDAQHLPMVGDRTNEAKGKELS
jgi:hypothetical protein